MAEAYYLYCITEAKTPVSSGMRGVEGAPVMRVPTRDLAAVVHPVEAITALERMAQPLASVAAHRRVVEAVWEQCQTVLPFAFGTLVRGERDDLQEWMREQHGRLARRLAQLRNKAEFGVQIFWHPERRAEALLAANDELKRLQRIAEDAGPGAACLHRRRLERALKEELERHADYLAHAMFERLQAAVSDIVAAKIKPSDDDEKPMLLNVSCLADKEQEKKLSDLLGQVNRMPEHRVRFTGPWPPYSFAEA